MLGRQICEPHMAILPHDVALEPVGLSTIKTRE